MTDVHHHHHEPEKEAIHPYRWRALTIWCTIFTIVVFIGIRQNRQALDRLKESKASIVSLQKTDCNLKSFLIKARNVRIRGIKDSEPPEQRKNDLLAAKGYDELLNPFTPDATGPNCHPPRLLPLPGS